MTRDDYTRLAAGVTRYGRSLYHADRAPSMAVRDLPRAALRARDAVYADAARCSCGCAEPHEVTARVRLTVDGYSVRGWSHGALSTTRDHAIGPGLDGGTAPRTVAAYRRALDEVLRDAECLTAVELVAACQEARARHLRDLDAMAREAVRRAM